MRDVIKKGLAVLSIVTLITTIFYPVAFAQNITSSTSSSVPATDESPRSLIYGAIAWIDQCSGSGPDGLAFSLARSSLNASTGDFWDDEHAKLGLCFVGHLAAVKAIQSTSAYKNSSMADHQAAFSAVDMVVQCDRKLADRSIAYACQVRSLVTDRLSLFVMNQSINGVTDGRYYNVPVLPVISVTDSHLQGSVITLDGEAYDGTAVVDDGDHVLSVRATDIAGNTAGASVSFVIDRTAPAVEIYGIRPNGYFGNTTVIDGVVTEANPGNVSLTIDGAEVARSLPYTWDTIGYPEGNHTVTLYATDKAGNTGSASVTVVVDNTPPIVKFLRPANGSLFSAGPIDFLWNGSDNYGISFYELLLGLQKFLVTGIGQTVDNIPDGSYQAVVKAFDMANNTADDSLNLTVDTIPPAINVSGVVDDEYYNYDVQPMVNVTDANLNFFASTLNDAQYDGEPVSAEGDYLLDVYAEDLAGNHASTAINFTIDKTQPSLLVNELTRNPNVLNLTYYLNGTIEPGAVLAINNETVFHDGRFEYSLNMSVGVNMVNVTATDLAGNVAAWNTTRLIDDDLLPDYYEVNVLRMDPLCNDSDSSMTPQDESGNGIPDDMEDLDGDGLINCMELMIGADPLKADTDDDGLNDMYELEQARTSPTLADTDGNDIGDGSEDPDGDGLNNLQERMFGTNPMAADTDGDGLNDNYERTVRSNPLIADSDDDGLTDDIEVKLGTNPLIADSDFDGIPDCDETYHTTASDESLGISVSVTGKGDLSKQLMFTNETSPYFTSNPSLVSPLVDINSSETFDSAIITMNYDPDRANDAPGLSLGYYNETLGLFITVPSTMDMLNQTVSASVSHFSVWGVFDMNALQEMYNNASSFNEENARMANPAGELSLNGHSLSWPYDIRFTGAGDVQLSYWIESYDDDSAVVWVEADQIPSAPDNALLNVYYGKAGDAVASDGPGTFLAFHGPGSGSYADTAVVGYDNLAYEASVRWTGELNSMVYGLKSQDDSDYMYMEFNGSGYRNGVAKNSETIGSVLISNGFGRYATARYEVTTIGSFAFYWDGSGRVYLSRSPTSLESTAADDAFDITTQYGSKSFQASGISVYRGIPDITSICRPGYNNVTVKVRDIWGTYIGCEPVYITTGKSFIVVTEPGVPAENEWQRIKITRSNNTARFYYGDQQMQPGVAVCLPDETLSMYSSVSCAAEQAYAFVRKYTSSEPSAGNVGLETYVPGSPSGYAYKNSVDILGSPDGALAGYPVKVVVYKETNTAGTDSDNDGLPDIVEENGFKDAQGHSYRTDPYDEDTDGDGLPDGEEAGTPLSNEYCKYYYNVKSDPTDDDTDDDGLTDFEEVRGTNTFHVANTRDDARNFWEAACTNMDPTPFLTPLQAFSDPKDDNSDPDGINDFDEVRLGTGPELYDTDGDLIPDNVEVQYGEEPAIYDLSPPDITVDDFLVYTNLIPGSPCGFLSTDYCFRYQATDLNGITIVKAIKNDYQQYSRQFSGKETLVSDQVRFTVSSTETAWDLFRVATVYVDADDRVGNHQHYLAWHQSSVFGTIAAQFGSDTIFQNGDIPGSIGVLSGGSAAIAEIPDSVIDFLNNPLEFISGIKELKNVIVDPEVRGQVIGSITQSLWEKEELENPYPAYVGLEEYLKYKNDKDTSLYDALSMIYAPHSENPELYENPLHKAYGDGWFYGYLGVQVAGIATGVEGTGFAALKAVKTTKEFATLIKQVAKNPGLIKDAIKASKVMRVIKLAATSFLERDAASCGLTNSAEMLAKAPTMVKKVQLWKSIKRIGQYKMAVLDGCHNELCEFLLRSGEDGAKLIERLDADTAKKIFTINPTGVNIKDIQKFRVSFARISIYYPDNPGIIREFINSIDNIKTEPGVFKQYLDGDLKTIMDRAISANSKDNWNSLINEVKWGSFYKDESKLVKIGPNEGRSDFEILGQNGNEFIELKTPVDSFAARKATDYVIDANKKFVYQKDKGLIDSNEKAKLVIDARGKTLGEDIDYIKDRIINQVSSWKQKGMDNKIDEIDILIDDPGSQSGYKTIIGDGTPVSIVWR